MGDPAKECLDCISSLANHWSAPLLFDEADPVAKTCDIYSSLVDLSQYMYIGHSLDDEKQPNFPAKTAYRFPIVYRGLQNQSTVISSLNSPLLQAAEHSGYKIMNRTTVHFVT
jgi:hypothetical protein